MCVIPHLYEETQCKYLEWLFFNICVSLSILIYFINTDIFKNQSPNFFVRVMLLQTKTFWFSFPAMFFRKA